MADERPSPGAAAALVVAWLVAFSPVIAELVRSVTAIDGRPAILAAPLLLALATHGQRALAAYRPRRGLALLGAGLALELVGIGLDVATLARLGLPVAALGLGDRLGRPGPAQMALLFFAVPVPISLSSLTTPWLESLHAALAERIGQSLFGADLVASGPLLRSAGRSLELFASDSGIWLAYVLAALGWLAALLRGRRRTALLRTAFLWSLAGWPAQLAAALVAACLLVAGLPELARAWLDWGLHAAVLLGGVALLSLRESASAAQR